ncbi:MAG: hypothetical protein V3V12_07995 [Gammaproteobacteria bacterium]
MNSPVLALRFLLASRSDIMGKVLGVVCRALATHLIHQAGYIRTTARTGRIPGLRVENWLIE